MALIFVDCEAVGPCPVPDKGWCMTEFGAVDYRSYEIEGRWETFHGILRSRDGKKTINFPDDVFNDFARWMKGLAHKGGVSMVSDNPAYDFQWINHGFWTSIGYNPFGHSARRISDFYAGLTGDFRNTQKWKRLRQTPHDHNPVHDAMGNVEAFHRIMKGER